MIGLPDFELATPETLEEACALLSRAGAHGRAIAGGTDLLVNVRHGLERPKLLVSLARIAALRGIRRAEDGALIIGAGETLAQVARDERVKADAAALSEAAAKVAHPQARSAGTLGGNLCLDVRCRYVDKPERWREALGGCFKTGAELCHVVKGGRQCVAALSGDTVAPLCALGAELNVHGPDGARRLPVAELRAGDGAQPLALLPGELVTSVRLPPPSGARVSAYRKWAVRQAVDFPLVSVALVLERSGAGAIQRVEVAAGALGPRPRLLRGLERFQGERLTPAIAKAIGDEAVRQCQPLANLPYDPAYRRRLLGVLVRRQLEAWAGPESG